MKRIAALVPIVASSAFAQCVMCFIVSNAVATILWTADTRLTLANGLMVVLCLVALGTVKVGQISYDNTRRILKAIELLSASEKN